MRPRRLATVSGVSALMPLHVRQFGSRDRCAILLVAAAGLEPAKARATPDRAYPSAPIVFPLKTRAPLPGRSLLGSGNRYTSALTPSRPTTSTLSTAPSSAAVSDRTTIYDVAGRIGAHEQTVRHWIKRGELKAARFGTRIGYRIRLGDYEDFLRRRTLTGTIAAHLLREAAAAPDA